MNDVPKIAIAAAVAGGYVLGRTKKGRVAFAVTTYLAGRRFGLEPQQLLTEGVKKLGELPKVAELSGQLRGEVFDAGRKAVSAVADRKFSGLADSIYQRTDRVGGKGKEAETEEEDEPEDEYEEEEEEEPEDKEEEESEMPEAKRRRAARKPDKGRDEGSRHGRDGTRRAAPGRAPAKKDAARKTAGKTSAPAKETAAKKASSQRRQIHGHHGT